MGKHTKQRLTVASSRRLSTKVWLGIGIALVAVLVVAVALFAGRSDQEATRSASAAASALPVVDVYKDATCGCCAKWVEHLEENGFTVRSTNTGALAAFKTSHGVPPQVRSCHTALVDGYVLEGHVPAAEVRRLLKERPPIAGLAVAGMPIGSPGMEVAGAQTQPYDVTAFDKQGATSAFASYR